LIAFSFFGKYASYRNFLKMIILVEISIEIVISVLGASGGEITIGDDSVGLMEFRIGYMSGMSSDDGI
jgi:hypothetical protein